MDIGIMQGRLSPRYKGRYQAFHPYCWESEFFVAKEIGFQRIEFIFDFGTEQENPLLSSSGIQRLNRVVRESGVRVTTICADYFMEAPFHSAHQARSEELFKELLTNASAVGVSDIVIPCVDQSSLKGENDKNELARSLERLLPEAEKADIKINLETDLNAGDFLDFMKRFSSPFLKVNYDTGNSASLGYKPQEEFECYGSYVSDVHIKDRLLSKGSVPLGTGDAPFDLIFSLLKKINFKGPITLQAARAERFEDEWTLVKAQLEFTQKLIQKYLVGCTENEKSN